MEGSSKRIKEEFGMHSEAEAVSAYGSLNRDFMYANYPLIAEELISRTNFKDGVILDIGTGLGTLAFEFAVRLPEAHIYGVDISPEMLDEAKRTAGEKKIENIKFILGDVQNLNMKDCSFDLIVSFGVLHHLTDLKSLFSGIKNLLKTEAVAYVYDLRKDAPQEVVSEIASSMNDASQRAFLESVREAYDLDYIKEVIEGVHFSEYALSYPQYCRSTIIKNKEILKKSRFIGERFNKILVECRLKK